METKFFKCRHCGNVIVTMVDSGVAVKCCGEEMQELKPGTTDASTEKHVPVVTRIDDCTIHVEVGSTPHPMLPEHHIAFIYVVTEHGGRFVTLCDRPSADICTCGDKVIAVLEYCNLHGLWKAEGV